MGEEAKGLRVSEGLEGGRCGREGEGGSREVVSYPDPDSHSCGWITSPLRGKWVWDFRTQKSF